jgi:hypothetical protein
MDVERADGNSVSYYDGNCSAIQVSKNAGHGTYDRSLLTGAPGSNRIVFERELKTSILRFTYSPIHLFTCFFSFCRFWLPLLVAVLQAKTIHGILLLDSVSSEQKKATEQ